MWVVFFNCCVLNHGTYEMLFLSVAMWIKYLFHFCLIFSTTITFSSFHSALKVRQGNIYVYIYIYIFVVHASVGLHENVVTPKSVNSLDYFFF